MGTMTRNELTCHRLRPDWDRYFLPIMEEISSKRRYWGDTKMAMREFLTRLWECRSWNLYTPSFTSHLRYCCMKVDSYKLQILIFDNDILKNYARIIIGWRCKYDRHMFIINIDCSPFCMLKNVSTLIFIIQERGKNESYRSSILLHDFDQQ